MSRSSAFKALASSAPSGLSETQSANRSSILRSSFAPSVFQLALFASVIQGFDSQQVRIHDTKSGRLRCEHAIASRATITCLAWGYHGLNTWENHRKEPRKKRRRTVQVNGTTSTDNVRDVVLAFGTSDSEIHLYSPAAAGIVGILKDAHSQGIRDFSFVDAGRCPEGWSIGGDGKLVHWDLRTGKNIRTISLPDISAKTLCPFGSSVLCASYKVLLVDPESSSPAKSFNASNNAVHSIRASALGSANPSCPSSFLTAAENDRFINVFHRETSSSIGSLVAENDVMKIALSSRSRHSPYEASAVTQPLDQAVGAINRDGVLELFESPFTFGDPSAAKEPESLKARMKQRTRKASAAVKVVRPDKSTTVVPLLDADFQDDELILVWTEGGVDLQFDRLQWRENDASKIVLEGLHVVTRGKSAAAVGAVVMNGVKDMGRRHVDESQTVVMTGGRSESTPMALDEPEVINISSAEEETDYEDEEPTKQMSHSSSTDGLPRQPVSQNGNLPSEGVDTAMDDASKKSSDAHEGATIANEPTFGEMIRANAPRPVDVQAAFAPPEAQALAPTSERLPQLPSGMSLGTVLTQSLRTNDVSLLETCFHMRDVDIVRATIERLDSSLAPLLIQKLAERLHSRPGRAGSLLIWIQWTVVAHGGYLTSQPGAMKTLASLHQVITERARSLPLLLSLKGKLDMLEAQMHLRATMQVRSKTHNMVEEDEDEGVVYVEGQEEHDSGGEAQEAQGSDGEDVEVDSIDNGLVIDDAMESGDDVGGVEEVEEDEKPSTLPNGLLPESDDAGSESSSDAFLDEEAESTDQDSGEEGSIQDVDHEDVDSQESDASSEANDAPPSKRAAPTMLSNGLESRKR
ncbi:MAG: hypothetical protein L6R35_000218 [Caloplaca aegaea]|nr:MAG: hypothetical protein L6R35_000218 [Caloplaca aegaea]